MLLNDGPLLHLKRINESLEAKFEWMGLNASGYVRYYFTIYMYTLVVFSFILDTCIYWLYCVTFYYAYSFPEDSLLSPPLFPPKEANPGLNIVNTNLPLTDQHCLALIHTCGSCLAISPPTNTASRYTHRFWTIIQFSMMSEVLDNFWTQSWISFLNGALYLKPKYFNCSIELLRCLG